MNAEELAAAIISDAHTEARKIARESIERTREIEKETSRLLREKRKETYAQAKLREERELRRQKAKRKQEHDLAVLGCKQDLIRDAFDTARERLKSLRGKERESLLEYLWKRAQEQMDITHAETARDDKNFLGKKTQVKEIDSIGGFIAHGDGVSLDYRFETLLDTVREKKIQEIAEVLFG